MLLDGHQSQNKRCCNAAFKTIPPLIVGTCLLFIMVLIVVIIGFTIKKPTTSKMMQHIALASLLIVSAMVRFC